MNERWNKQDDNALAEMEQQMAGDLRNAMQSATVYAERSWQRRGTAHGDVAGVLAAASARRQVGSRSFAAAGLLLASLVGGMVAVRSIKRPASTPAVVGAAHSAESDEALLDSIQSDVDTTVPAAMEPLVASDVRASAPAVRRGTERKSE